MVNITPGHFTPEEESRYPLNRRLGGPQSRSGRFGEEKKFLPLSELVHWPASPWPGRYAVSLTRLLKLFYVGVKFGHSVREEQRLKVFEKRVLRTVFEPKKEEVARAGPPTAGSGPVGEIFSGPPGKGVPAKNLYTKSERLTLRFRVTWVWSERVSLSN
jgi:hypothetical protein